VGDFLSSLLLNFSLEYAIRRVHVKQDGLKLNVTHQLLFYADDVYTMGESFCIVKKNVEALVAVSKEIGLEVNADKTKYMVMSRDQNAGRSQNIKSGNSSCERVEDCKDLGTILTNENSIRKEIKSRLKSGSAC
jgi:DNA/RNA endonuclease G (NUC1)